MARIRSIHPGFFTDESLATLDARALVLLIGIWTECDDQGVFEWRPVRLKMRLFPVANVDVPALLEELIAVDAIKKVEAGGVHYGLVRNFRRFQRPKSPNAIHPMCPEWGRYVGLSPTIGEMSPVEGGAFPGNGPEPPQMEDGGDKMEEVGVESPPPASSDSLSAPKPKRRRRTTLPADWQPTQELLDYAKQQGCADPGDTAERFRLHHRSKGTLGADWDLGFQYWCRNEKRFPGGTGPPPKTAGWN